MKPLTLSRGLTLIEILVVLALVAMLASMVTIVIVHARHFSYQVECQENLRQIGQTVNQIAMNNNGEYPGYLTTVVNDDASASYTLPWWVTVYRQWDSSRDLLDDKADAFGIQLPDQVPAAMKSFHCRMAEPITPTPATDDETKMKNWMRRLSYGLNVNVKLNDGKTPYTCVADTDSAYPALQNPPSTEDDRNPDKFFMSEIQTPAEFILLSECHVEPWDANDWGARIAPSAMTSAAHPRSPIIGRHSGRANVLFADMHIDTVDAVKDIKQDPPDGPWTGEINLNNPLWTLPDD